MESEIRFFLLEQPRNVSDMITELTEKTLSSDPERRSEQIPRIAGNWYKKDRGYLWRLQEQGEIQDLGRRYEIDRDWLVDGFLQHMGVQRAFPRIKSNGDTAELSDAYSDILPDYTYGRLRHVLKEQVFSGATMAEMCSFAAWRDVLLVPDEDGRRIRSRRLVFDFWSSVQFITISTVLKSRISVLEGRVEADEQPFTAKRRVSQLEATRAGLCERIIGTSFPWNEQYSWEEYRDPRLRALDEAFGRTGAVLDEEALSVLGDAYLLALGDGPQLHQQFARFGGDEHLLFELFERGWMVDQGEVVEDEETGRIIIPLDRVRSYLLELARLFQPTDAIQPDQ